MVALKVSKNSLKRLNKLPKGLQNAKEAGMKQSMLIKILKAAQKLHDERIKIAETAKRRLEKGSELNKLEELARKVVNKGQE